MENDMENKEVPIWILVGSEYDDKEDTENDVAWTYALEHNHLPHGGWQNQGLNERVENKLFSINSIEVASATNNTRLYIEEQVKKWEFLLEFSEELDQDFKSLYQTDEYMEE